MKHANNPDLPPQITNLIRSSKRSIRKLINIIHHNNRRRETIDIDIKGEGNGNPL